MAGTEIEQFLGAGRDLADRKGLPTTRPRIIESWNPHEVHTIKLETMLGQVAIMPQQTDHVSLAGFGGDEEMISRLRANVQSGVLNIEGELPFKPGQSGGGSHNVFGDNVVIMSGSAYIGGGSFSTNGRGGQRRLIVGGREVDLSRHIQLAIIVPVGTNVRVGDIVGAVGIGPNLGGALDFTARFDTHIFAYDVTELTGEVIGQGHAEVQLVQESADVHVSGQGNFILGSVSGKFDARVSGQGNIRVAGGSSRSMRARVSGQGSIDHRGTVLDSANLRVSGMGSINANRVSGDVDARVSGMGNIVANGRTYRPRW
ncbi:MAG TPA: DUF2807 domain-containing protein [Candidatus Saccharimonadales bacterium]|jgi:hypothetical protein